ncbi:hypothetical protein [Amycolatopsis sp. Hca4]|uniref:hypothetical protein n=1 Tax=Amycolatopsis sp. Hca4 TaxID=2742131 RepID=UPI00158FAC07|nr:hypothetical protein [Amycolatopsis sp. Hca4]QKV77614.1 hypothetical protein HUT10_30470 [Amycolatopsis sp. Hca4]
MFAWARRHLIRLEAATVASRILAKRADAPHRPGTRSSDWIKTPLRPTTEVLIRGWLPGTGRRARSFGALLVGAHDDTGRLVWLGNVGTGFTDVLIPGLRAGRARRDRRRDAGHDHDASDHRAHAQASV